MIRHLLRILNVTLISFFCVVFSLTSYCQERTGIIRGKVTDSEGVSLPGVTLTIRGPAITSRSTITNEHGIYVFNDLLAGEYSIEAVLPGFKKTVKENIPVLIGEIKIVNFAMDVETIPEEVTVKAETPIVDLDKASIAKWSVLGELAEAVIELKKSPDFEKNLNEELVSLTEGKILFNPPKEMKQYSKERIEVRISKNLNNDLSEGLRGKGLPEIEDILVSDEMKVILSGDAFKIKSLSEPVQIISSTEPTQWEWDVTPLKSGYRLICLSVSILINLDQYGNKKKSLPVMEKEVYIKVNVPGVVLEFIKNYWYAIIAAIGVLFGIIFGYKRLKLAYCVFW
jgi:hypothetical protein